jgi:ribosomal protein S12 methylthiotransferase
VLRTTFLTGFPGETDEAAENTARFLSEIQPDWSGCFPYSREEDTPAYSMKGRVPVRVAKARAAHLEELQTAITAERLNSFVGKELNILVEELITNGENEASGENEGLAIGRAWFQAPEVDGSVVIRYDLDDPEAVSSIIPGSVVTVKVLASTGVDLDSRFTKIYRKKSGKNERKFIF